MVDENLLTAVASFYERVKNELDASRLNTLRYASISKKEADGTLIFISQNMKEILVHFEGYSVLFTKDGTFIHNHILDLRGHAQTRTRTDESVLIQQNTVKSERHQVVDVDYAVTSDTLTEINETGQSRIFSTIRNKLAKINFSEARIDWQLHTEANSKISAIKLSPLYLANDFHQKHSSEFQKVKSAFGGSFRSTRLNLEANLEQILEHALNNKNGRSMQICKTAEFNWFNKNGTLNYDAPPVVKDIVTRLTTDENTLARRFHMLNQGTFSRHHFWSSASSTLANDADLKTILQEALNNPRGPTMKICKSDAFNWFDAKGNLSKDAPQVVKEAAYDIQSNFKY